MITFTFHAEPVTGIGLGLTADTVAQLQAGQPQRVWLRDLGCTGPLGDVMIWLTYAPDEATLRQAMAPLIGADSSGSHVTSAQT
jgi:hypothetical protein